MSIKTGTKSLKNVTVKNAKGGVRKVRCQGCRGFAVEVPDGQGGTKFRCSGCGTEYHSTTM